MSHYDCENLLWFNSYKPLISAPSWLCFDWVNSSWDCPIHSTENLTKTAIMRDNHYRVKRTHKRDMKIKPIDIIDLNENLWTSWSDFCFVLVPLTLLELWLKSRCFTRYKIYVKQATWSEDERSLSLSSPFDLSTVHFTLFIPLMAPCKIIRRFSGPKQTQKFVKELKHEKAESNKFSCHMFAPVRDERQKFQVFRSLVRDTCEINSFSRYKLPSIIRPSIISAHSYSDAASATDDDQKI